jgi:ribonucleoside-diphosphate reductase alpha chain
MKHAKADPEWEVIRKDILKYGIRNAKLLSVAPTGTISMAYGNNCSSGIEPIFCLEYDRKIKIGGQSEENARIVPMRDYAYQLWKDNVETNVRKDVFTTALNISVDDHIKMLSTIAYHIDMSVSKTINVPSSYTLEQTKNIYIDCWRQKIKGCTIFRPNEIRQGILIDKSTQPIKEEALPKDEPSQFPRGVVESVPDYLSYKKYKLETGCGSLYLFLGIDESDGRIYDCFTNTDGTGGCSVNTQANSRLLSLCLRGGIPIDKIIQQLNKSGTCPSFQYHRGAGKKLCAGKSCPSAIANVLKDVLKESELMQEEEIETPSKIQRVEKIIETHGFIAEKSFNNCPECNASLVNEGGCKICKQCGYSKCN